MKRKFSRAVALVAFALVFVLVGVAAQEGPDTFTSPQPTPTPVDPGDPQPVDPGEIPTLPDFLETLAGPAGWLMLGTLASMMLAEWAWYNKQPFAIKRAIPIALAALASMLARALIVAVPVSVWAAIAPYWMIIAGTVATWVGSQAWYQLGVRPNKPE